MYMCVAVSPGMNKESVLASCFFWMAVFARRWMVTRETTHSRAKRGCTEKCGMQISPQWCISRNNYSLQKTCRSNRLTPTIHRLVQPVWSNAVVAILCVSQTGIKWSKLHSNSLRSCSDSKVSNLISSAGTFSSWPWGKNSCTLNKKVCRVSHFHALFAA